MHTTLIRFCLALGLIAAAVDPGSARAQDFLSQDWLLNPRLSNVYMQTVKNNALFETHQFTAVEGNISKNADATVKIESGFDRDWRRRARRAHAFPAVRDLQVPPRGDQRQARQSQVAGPRDRDPRELPAQAHPQHAWDHEGDRSAGLGHAHQRHHRVGGDDQAGHRHRGKLRACGRRRQARGSGRRNTHCHGCVDNLRSGVRDRQSQAGARVRRGQAGKRAGPSRRPPASRPRLARPGSA